ncbi:MAG: hypothetical protein ACOC93_01130 [Planctomycetota bacterium]
MMHYRSISSHRGCPDPQVIDLAARLGFNDVCFQTEGDQPFMLAELRDRADRSGLFNRIKRHGMTVSVWVHEFEDLDPAWGELAIANEALWSGLRQRYETLLTEQVPEIDYLVLTVVESTVRCTEPAMLERLVLLLREVCHACGKRLMIRSFVWTLEEFHGVRETISRLPDDVLVMTKYVPQDWHRGEIHHPLIGQVGGKEQVIELDIAGEYFRGDYLAHCFADELHERFAYWGEQSVAGLSVRIDRGWQPWLHHHNVLHEVQEANLWCVGMWASGEADDVETPLIGWASERFGPQAAPEMAAIARLCDPVVKEAMTVCGEPFGDTRRNQPALRSMRPPREQPATIYQPARAENHVDPFCRWLALWRWAPELTPRYDRLRQGDPALARQKATHQARALELADEALARLEAIRGELGADAWQFLQFKLEENRHHLVLMGHAAQAWLACLRLPHLEDSERPAIHEQIAQHLHAMLAEWQAHRHESAVVVWPAGHTRQLKRCEYLDVPGFCREMRRYAQIPSASPEEPAS